MDRLFPEIAAKVAEYLTPQDLSVCCAVSSHWREVFGTNEVWKRLCNQEMEEHLKTTPCVVDPVFPLSLCEDSTLAPPSQWRLAFLREQHLWRNWRKGNFKIVEHNMDVTKISLERFITNDFIVSFRQCSVELWDVRPLPPVKVNSLVFNNSEYYIPTVFENGIVVLDKNGGKIRYVLKVDVIEGTITLKYQLCLNDMTQTPDLVPIYNNQPNIRSELIKNFSITIIKGKFCIVFRRFKRGSNSFHIWDLENGVKLKEESLPEPEFEGFSIKASKTCDNILVLIPYDIAEGVQSLKCLVYNVQQLSFFSFKQNWTVVRPIMHEFFAEIRSDQSCAIINGFVALIDYIENEMKIFNYQTCELVFGSKAILDVQALGDSGFIFTHKMEEELSLWYVFCPSGNVIKSVEVTCYDVENFECVGNRFVEVFSEQPEVWAINRLFSFKTAVYFPEFREVNQACTRLITENTVEEIDMIRILHFW